MGSNVIHCLSVDPPQLLRTDFTVTGRCCGGSSSSCRMMLLCFCSPLSKLACPSLSQHCDPFPNVRLGKGGGQSCAIHPLSQRSVVSWRSTWSLDAAKRESCIDRGSLREQIAAQPTTSPPSASPLYLRASQITEELPCGSQTSKRNVGVSPANASGKEGHTACRGWGNGAPGVSQGLGNGVSSETASPSVDRQRHMKQRPCPSRTYVRCALDEQSQQHQELQNRLTDGPASLATRVQQSRFEYLRGRYESLPRRIRFTETLLVTITIHVPVSYLSTAAPLRRKSVPSRGPTHPTAVRQGAGLW
ncbi:hypothetical protein VTI74DRAFT_7188 [Chaetomium olivicolor]